MRRRRLIEAGVAAGIVAAMPVAARASNQLAFEVRRNGTPIGHHRLQFVRRGSELHVSIAIDLSVTLAFITLYSYRHSNREVWRDGAFQSFASRTDDDGETFTAGARRIGDKIEVRGQDGTSLQPGDLMPTTYWHREFMLRDRWIDTQSGRVVVSEVTDLGIETLTTPVGSFEAHRYQVRGDLDVDLWYRATQWVGLAFKGPDGSAIDYQLIEEPIQDVSLR